MPSSETRGDLFDYATRSALSAPQDEGIAESNRTILELVESFGEDSVLLAIQQTPLFARFALSNNRLNEALRAFAIIIAESRWPKLDALLIGRLVQMEVATGRRLKMDELGRTFGGQSKQAISKRQGEIAERLGLPNPDSTPESREAHRLMNRSNRNIA
jgi:hypothetical protein